MADEAVNPRELTHAPEGYQCPFCLVLAGVVNEHVKSRPDEIVYRDENVAVLIATRWWAAAPGQALVVPVEHFENLYSVPPAVHHAMADITQRVAIAMRQSYPNCTGITTRQHNEFDGGQDLWHMHVHVFARTKDDNFYFRQQELIDSTPEQRQPYVERLRRAMSIQN